MDVKDLRGKKIAFAASGGLDGFTINDWLAQQDIEGNKLSNHALI